MNIQNNRYSIRRENYDGKPHMVVPVVMMVEGVHSGSEGPVLHLAEELSHMVPAWNGIPVVIQHPQDDSGNFISANSPSVPYVGRVFNARFEDGKLKAEAWIAVSTITQVSPVTLGYLTQQRPLDVSVGVFTDTERTTGEWEDGAEYIGIARNYRPDHLALLPGEEGACNWADGCGIRTNKKVSTNGGKGSGNFGHSGRPGERGGSGDGGGSNEDSALSLSFQNAGMEQSAANDLAFGIERLQEKGNIDADDVKYVQKLVNKGKFDLATKIVNDAYTNAISNNAKKKKNTDKMKKEEYLVTNSLQNRQNEYTAIVEAVRSKINAMDNEMAWHYVIEIYDDGLIYMSRNRQTNKETFYKQTYSVDAETGAVLFDAQPEMVVRTVNFEPTTQNNSKTTNNKKERKPKMENNSKTACFIGKVERIIANESTRFSEEDREMLMELPEEALDKMLPKMQANRKKEEEAVLTDETVSAYLQGKKTEEVIKLLPGELQSNVTGMMAERKERRDKMIADIMQANKGFKEEELQAMSCTTLQNVHAVATNAEGVDYSGRGTGQQQQQVETNKKVTTPSEEEPLMSI